MKAAPLPSWPKVGMVVRGIYSGQMFRITKVGRESSTAIRVETGENVNIPNNQHAFMEVKHVQ